MSLHARHRVYVLFMILASLRSNIVPLSSSLGLAAGQGKYKNHMKYFAEIVAFVDDREKARKIAKAGGKTL